MYKNKQRRLRVYNIIVFIIPEVHRSLAESEAEPMQVPLSLAKSEVEFAQTLAETEVVALRSLAQSEVVERDALAKSKVVAASAFFFAYIDVVVKSFA